MNSYYPEVNLKGDPVMVGKLEAGEYQCLLQSPTTSILADAERIYVEFDGTYGNLSDTELTLSVVTDVWSLNRLTFANQPVRQAVHTFVLNQQLINETLSLDITGLIPEFITQPNAEISIHLSAGSGLLRLSNPRLTVITNHRHVPGKDETS
jgi:hypothetical protein